LLSAIKQLHEAAECRAWPSVLTVRAEEASAQSVVRFAKHRPERKLAMNRTSSSAVGKSKTTTGETAFSLAVVDVPARLALTRQIQRGKKRCVGCRSAQVAATPAFLSTALAGS